MTLERNLRHIDQSSGAGAPPDGRAHARSEAANPDNDAAGRLLRRLKGYSQAELTLAKAERQEDEARDLAATRRRTRADRRRARYLARAQRAHSRHCRRFGPASIRDRAFYRSSKAGSQPVAN